MTATHPVTAEHMRRFREDGFFILENIIPPHNLQSLHADCLRLVGQRDAEMDRLGVDRLELDHRGRRYFLPAYDHSQAAREFAFSPTMTAIARATLGKDACLFGDQYVVKAAERGMTFSWHQDSGFVGYPHRPYLTCWAALDDVTEANGTVYLLPYSRAGTREVVPHVRDEQTGDLVGYSGGDPGDPVIVPAGSIACFSSTVLHRSGPNTTANLRCVYLAQYSAGPIMSADGRSLRHRAEPLPAGGTR